jgi:SET domain-containing protein
LSTRKPVLVRRRSPISGWGVYATSAVTKNTRVIDYAGELISRAECRRRARRQNRRGQVWCFIISRVQARDAAVGGNLARFINHSCRPNCYVDIAGDIIWIRASRRIRAGEELSYDYSLVPPLGIKCRCRPGCPTVL